LSGGSGKRIRVNGPGGRLFTRRFVSLRLIFLKTRASAPLVCSYIPHIDDNVIILRSSLRYLVSLIFMKVSGANTMRRLIMGCFEETTS
jgi:hypothetical protein